MIGFVNKGAGLRGATVILAGLLLAACSQPMVKSRPQQPEAVPQPVAPQAEPAPQALPEPPRQKAAPISPTLLYEVLLGEIAGQRGIMDVSAASYLEAALHSSDPRVAERALKNATLSYLALTDAGPALAAAQARLAIAEDRLTKTSLASPIDGVVERRYVSVGDFVQAGTPVIWITDTVALRVDMPFPETVAHRLQVGQPVILESPVAPGVRQTAQIDTIRPNVGELNRALVAMARIENAGAWRPGAHADASVVVDRRPGAVLVPFMAVVERPGQ